MATPIPANSARFSLSEITQTTSGTCALGAPDLAVEGVTTDSRSDVSGKLFVALRGDRFDGHRFAADAVRAGARVLLVQKGALPGGVGAEVPVVEVEDTLSALGALARMHRRRWGGPLVAVAGSAGKTTTRSTIAAALEAVLPGAVHSVPGNLNNRIGVPMVLFGLSALHGAAVVEIGTNRSGEVRELTHIAAPNVGVLTLVDVEHSEGLGSLDDIEEEEGSLLRGLPKNGAAIANGDDERAVRQLVASTPRKKISYGTRGAVDYRIERREAVGLDGSRVTLERPKGRSRETIALDVQLFGLPGALAVAAAVAVADRIAARTVPVDRLASAFARGTLGEPGRLRPIELGDHTVVLDDSYNANPASVRAAVTAARELADDRSARLMLVLGEMRELGALSPSEHEAVGEFVGESGAAGLVAVGGDAARFVPKAAALGVDAAFAPDSDQAVAEVLVRVRPGDVVLVKASRGVQAERIVEALVRAKGRAA
jgi:UDP-N-acetylmuramoyl-tripeptide--D-alanyl-D-alanine ligase